MGNAFTVPNLDPNVEFIMYSQSKCDRFGFPYPTFNQEFQQRVLLDEWQFFIDEMKSTGLNPSILVGGIFVVLILCIIIAATVSPAVFLLIFVCVFAVFGYQIYWMSQVRTVVENFNEGLFKKRGIRVRFHPGGKHSLPQIHVVMAYPATPAAASMLQFSSRYYGGGCGTEPGTPDPGAIARIEAKFREQNDIFARAPLATSAGVVPYGSPPQWQGYPQQHHHQQEQIMMQSMPPQSGGQFHGYQPVQAAYETQQQLIQVRVPPDARPGSTFQVMHFGAPMNITIPPNVSPGQMMTVSIPPPLHAQEQQQQRQYTQSVATAQVPSATPVYEATPVASVITAQKW